MTTLQKTAPGQDIHGEPNSSGSTSGMSTTFGTTGAPYGNHDFGIDHLNHPALGSGSTDLRGFNSGSTSGLASPSFTLPDDAHDQALFGLFCGDLNSNQADFQSFADEMQLNGMPAGFLQVVAKNYNIGSKSDTLLPFLHAPNSVQQACNQMYLSDDVMDDILDLDLEGKGNSSGGVQTAYHEGTHAFLDLMKSDPKYADFIKKGTDDYRGAKLDHKKGKVDDPERVFEEAAASYVGWRASAYWSAYDGLHDLMGRIGKGEIPADKVDDYLAIYRESYNESMMERKFGYQMKGGKQVEVDQSISPEMKGFLDSELLQGQFNDDFDADPGLAQLISKIKGGG